MQILAPCGFRCTYLRCLPTTHEQFGVTKICGGPKNSRVTVSWAKDSPRQVKSLPSSIFGGSRSSWRVAVSTQDEVALGEGRETTIPEDTQSSSEEKGQPLVKVKFVLQKKCRFGQQFNVIGNDPLLGTWDPKAALPLKWSEGDEWTKEVDVPIGKQIEYKFLLTDKRGEHVWQPGPNRVFETLASDSPLVVSSTWELDEKVVSETQSEAETVEDTEEGDTDKISDAMLVEGLSPNATSDDGESTSKGDEVSSDTPYGVSGPTSVTDTKDNAEGEDSVVNLSGAADALGVSNGANEKRGAASTTEAI